MGNFISTLTSLTGGGAKSLDSIDGNALSDGDLAEVWTSTGIYRYRLDATASATENSPLRINPDTNAGTKSWCLVWTSVRIGALVKLTVDQEFTNSVGADVDWETEVYDDAGFWEGVTNPERLTIPVGVTNAIVKAGYRWETNANGVRSGTLFKNGVATFDGRPAESQRANDSTTDFVIVSPKLAVTSGDYFTSYGNQTSGIALDLLASNPTWFSIEATNFA